MLHAALDDELLVLLSMFRTQGHPARQISLDVPIVRRDNNCATSVVSCGRRGSDCLDRHGGDSLVFLFFVVTGVCVAYYAAAGWLNRTHIVVSRDKITVRHEPVPWLGNFEMKVSEFIRPPDEQMPSRAVP